MKANDFAEPIYHEISKELERAIEKFPTWPTDPLHALAVLGEEYGELVKGMLQLVYEPNKTTIDATRREAIQTAAMVVRLIISLGAYEYEKSHQHSQDGTQAKQLAMFHGRRA